jgi:hypothetical protein
VSEIRGDSREALKSCHVKPVPASTCADDCTQLG